MSEPELSKYQSRSKRLLQNHDTLVQWVQQGLNIFAVSLPLIILAGRYDFGFESQYRSMLVFAILLQLIIYNAFGVNRRFENLIGGVQHLARAWGTVIIVLALVSFLTKTSESYSRKVIVYWVVISYFLQAAVFLGTYKFYSHYRAKYQERIPSLIIGTGSVAKHLAKSITNNIWLADKVVGVINYGKDEIHEWTLANIPILGTEENLHEVIETRKIRRIYVALPFSHIHLVKDVQELLIDSNLDIVWAPDIFELRLLNHSVREVAGVPLINLNETPLMAGGPAFIKAFMDKSIALLVLMMISPLMLTIAAIVKFTSDGPIIFKQIRDGWDGKKFYVYKFRSMYVHTPEKVVKQATKGDPRITPIGRIIRKTSIDELPQLFNVLEGSMSLVGPRPHAVSHNEYYSDKVRAYLARHRIKPGMTGLAQINGLRGETETVELMERRVEFDLEYISNWSPMLDFKIMFLTPFSLLNSKAY